ncbi:MAG: DMT family transporter [Lachnospirales bacterium]
MYYLLSMGIGVLISISILFNGNLSASYGDIYGLFYIHLFGFILTAIICIYKKEKPFRRFGVSPFYYLGGCIGVLTVIGNVYSFGKISTTAIVGLGLLGQTITSIVIDNYGLLNMEKSKYNKSDIIGISVVLVGITVLIFGSNYAFMPIVLSLLAGITSVVARTVNAKLAKESTPYVSTMYNYITGISFSVIIILLFARNEIASADYGLNILWAFGGCFGVLIVSLYNICIYKISSIYTSLCTFVGQILTSIILDILMAGEFSIQNFMGGFFVTLGLFINLMLEKNRQK